VKPVLPTFKNSGTASHIIAGVRRGLLAFHRGSLQQQGLMPHRRQGSRDTLQRMMRVAALLLVSLASSEWTQPSAPNSFLEEAGALQSKLSQWRQKLNNLRLIPRPAVSNPEIQLLRRDRSACIKWISALDADITAIESAPTLQGEACVVLDLEHLQGAVANMDDSLGSVTALGIAPPLGTFSGNLGFRLFQELRATTTAHKPQKPGAIGGRIYRADTDKPLTGVKVMLGLASSFGSPFRTVQTRPDGAYPFSDVPPGQYRVGAYLKGFTHGQYGPTTHMGSEWTTINLASGQKVGGTDIRLHPLVSVTQMNEEALAAAFGGGRFWLKFGPGPFSPDGKLFAFTVGDPDPYQAWLYNLSSKRLMPITAKPAGGLPNICGMAWVGETLYAEVAPQGCPNHLRFFAANAEGARQISPLPAAAQAALNRAITRQSGTVSEGGFTVSAVHQTCYHCAGLNLTVRQAEGGKPYVIARGSWELGNFALENHGSLVLFPRFFYSAIAMFDLNTHRVREGCLPTRAESLLDASADPGGFLVAYSSYGPCQGYGDQGALYPIHPVRAPYNVCFATIPYKAEEGASGARK
jgi:hypothetical protein